ncbi:MAG: 4a-hydroxytetrahydrobiopterin dehydratase [Nitrospinae bacterium]|nr:4a-hydroxytetrahydrobiopterin dehydratase [Nitrospinota bacterium]
MAKTYRFATFLGGIEFINRVAEIAEEVDHHPDIAVHYRRVTFNLWTHSVGGLTEGDFDLARRIEEAFQARGE